MESLTKRTLRDTSYNTAPQALPACGSDRQVQADTKNWYSHYHSVWPLSSNLCSQHLGPSRLLPLGQVTIH